MKIGEASPKGRMDMPMGRGGGGGNMRMLSGGQGGGFPAQNFDAHFGPMGFGGAQGFAGESYRVPVEITYIIRTVGLSYLTFFPFWHFYIV